eukprot:GHVR01037564.1.p2 GENE.GHVR01037564.1~~GHVR01037564.1.p2  ORF type:complete len:415 (+),score=81.63 GHVR01037564.1:517-1761(+)
MPINEAMSVITSFLETEELYSPSTKPSTLPGSKPSKPTGPIRRIKYLESLSVAIANNEHSSVQEFYKYIKSFQFIEKEAKGLYGARAYCLMLSLWYDKSAMLLLEDNVLEFKLDDNRDKVRIRLFNPKRGKDIKTIDDDMIKISPFIEFNVDVDDVFDTYIIVRMIQFYTQNTKLKKDTTTKKDYDELIGQWGKDMVDSDTMLTTYKDYGVRLGRGTSSFEKNIVYLLMSMVMDGVSDDKINAWMLVKSSLLIGYLNDNRMKPSPDVDHCRYMLSVRKAALKEIYLCSKQSDKYGEIILNKCKGINILEEKCDQTNRFVNNPIKFTVGTITEPEVNFEYDAVVPDSNWKPISLTVPDNKNQLLSYFKIIQSVIDLYENTDASNNFKFDRKDNKNLTTSLILSLSKSDDWLNMDN